LSHQSHQLKRKTNFGEASDFEIWQVARAATAAPFYFKPLHVDLHPMRVDQEPEYMLFSDGGFGTTNNPTQEGVLEIQNLHGQHAIGVVVSIGTARGGEKFGAGTLDQVKNSYDKLTDPDTVHQNLRSSRNFADYYRLNAQKDNGLNVPMDEWKPHGMFSGKRRPGQVTLEKIRNHFLLWYSNLNNQGTLNKCAHQLVLRRRARLHDIHRWERFATGAHFYCSEINCEAEFSNRQDFMDHLMGHEKWDQPEDIEDDYLRRHTNYWEYRRPPTNG
jgi:hypothetical protein